MIVGVLGAGQLARMLALAGHPLGVRCTVLAPSRNNPAAAVAAEICAPFDDEAALTALAREADVVTYEFENVPARSVHVLAQHVTVYPPAEALASSQDRSREKRLFQRLGIPTPPFMEVDTRDDLERAVASIGTPAVLKTRSQGYDGKGQAVIRRTEDIAAATGAVAGAPAILEGFVPFTREVSVIAARSRAGETVFYPLVENTHRGGILRQSICRPDDRLHGRAVDYAQRLLDALDYVGILALELFDVNGELVANEFAPRVHNSGHWTIEGAETSQFENHLRAILGLPLGSTRPLGHAGMVNFIGDVPDAARVLSAVPDAHLHVYGKAPRAGRKVGHATVRSPDEQTLRASLERLCALAGC